MDASTKSTADPTQGRTLRSTATLLTYYFSFAVSIMALLYFLLSLGDLGQAKTATAASVSPSLPGVKAYTPPFGFPTSAFASYYFLPASPTQEPQPALYDPVLN